MTIDQTICQPKLRMKRDRNAQSSIEVSKKIRSPLSAIKSHFQFLISLSFFLAFFSTFFSTFSWLFFSIFFLTFFKIFPDFFLYFFPTFFSTFFPTFFLIFSRLSANRGWPQSSYCCDVYLANTADWYRYQNENLSLQWDAKTTSAFAVLLILTFALKTFTCDGVLVANYIPTLQEYPLNVMT